jgi:hypothetical protein
MVYALFGKKLELQSAFDILDALSKAHGSRFTSWEWAQIENHPDFLRKYGAKWTEHWLMLAKSQDTEDRLLTFWWDFDGRGIPMAVFLHCAEKGTVTEVYRHRRYKPQFSSNELQDFFRRFARPAPTRNSED